ncbi:delta protein precursor [Saccoglossus kowalevskii]|uniref:Delta-like protein n=1 Tax=Saccoglossus kowalevskii TaxID=10224 RepID=B5B3T0_SACKO|nr:delta protein precursor [Saccoglossus kowalevskii]ACG70192.1 delta protein [Saccoglossus kowalevskii]
MGGLVVSRSSGQFFAVCLLTVLTQVSCSGIFQLRLASFSNDQGRNVSGQCCSVSSTSSDTCGSPCRTFFRVCLKHYQAHVSTDDDCIYGEVETPILGNNTFEIPLSDMETFINPIRLPFTFRWPGTFSLVIEAFHSVEVGPNGFPYPGSPRSLIARLATQRFAAVGFEWNTEVYSSEDTDSELHYSYRIVCDEHYFGEECSDFCRPRDDNLGHYTCDAFGNKVCLPGWGGDSVEEYCSVPICKEGCHEQHGSCDSPGECTCMFGYEGEYCDECIVYPGCQHGYCTQPYVCICYEGWGGQLCNQDLAFCTHHKPCKNGGTCSNGNSGGNLYTCTCPPGFTGTDCEVEIDDCIDNPCQNGGVCNDLINNYACQCPPAFTGVHCEILIESCSEHPCQNGATCVENGADFICTCSDGYTGHRCEQEIDYCSSEPCQNGATCIIDQQSGFICQCAPGFEGTACENQLEFCDPDPCQNGATCHNGPYNFYCDCVPGYIGDLCENDFDECLLLPCSNGGTCSDLVNNFHCECPAGFTGKDCSVAVDLCQSNPCHNGGICANHINGYVCACSEGFYGRDCERLTSEELLTTAVLIDEIRTTPSDQEIITTTVSPSTVTVAAPVSTTTAANAAVGVGEHSITVMSLTTLASTEGVAVESGESRSSTPTEVYLIVVIAAVAIIVPAIILFVICLVYRQRTRRNSSKREDSESPEMNNRICERDLKAMKSKEIDISPPSSISVKVCNEESNSLKKTNRDLKKLKEFENDFKAEKALQQNAQLFSQELSMKCNQRVAKPMNSEDCVSSTSFSSSAKDYKSSKRKELEQPYHLKDCEKIVHCAADSVDSVHYKITNTVRHCTSSYGEKTPQNSDCFENPCPRKGYPMSSSCNTLYLSDESLSPKATEV